VHYLPLTPGFFSILVFVFAGLIILIQLRILRYAYMRLGVGPGAALLLLFGSLIGSYFNIPVTILPGETMRSGQAVDFFGMQYVVPVMVSSPGTVLAVNVGGAVIPTVMSTYVVIRYQLWLKGAIATAVIAAIIHSMATPVPGIGIAVPVFAPVVATAIIAFILSREYAAPLAYIGGSMGTLIGADLLNLEDHRPWRAGRLDRRRRHIRRHIPDRHSRRAARRHRIALAPAAGLVSRYIPRGEQCPAARVATPLNSP
jgi:uncharacterized membrane protein